MTVTRGGKTSIAARLRSIPKKRAPVVQEKRPDAAYAHLLPDDDVFACVRRNRNTQLANQRAALALLDATEGAIFARGLPFAPESYWAALFPVLVADGAPHHVAPAAYLLSLLVPRMPSPAMRAAYSDVYGHLPRVAAEGQADAPLVRACISIFGAAVASVLDSDSPAGGLDSSRQAAHVESERPSAREVLRILIVLASDARPKVRHLAQETLGRLYAHAALPRAWRGDAASAVCCVLDDATRKESTGAQHALPLARELLRVGAPGCARLFASVARCASLGSAPLAVQSLSILSDAGDTPSLPQSCIDEVRASLLSACPDSAPDVLPAWLAAVSSLPGASDAGVDAVLECLACPASATTPSVLDAVEAALVRVLAPSSALRIAARLVRWLAVKGAPCVPHAVRVLGHAAPHMAGASSGGGVCVSLDEGVCAVVQALGDAHDGKQGRHAALIEAALARYVASFGPEAVLAALPLNLLVSGARPRAWLLAVVRDSPSRCRLAYFADALLPLVSALQTRAAEAEAQDKAGDARVHRLVATQVWSTLGAFLRGAVDAVDVLPRVGPSMAEAIAGDADARPVLLSALASYANNVRDSPEDAHRREHLAAWGAPRLVPLLFNVFGATPSDARGGVVHALEAVLGVLSPSERESYLQRVVLRLGSCGDAEQAASMLELASVLVRASQSHGAGSGVDSMAEGCADRESIPSGGPAVSREAMDALVDGVLSLLRVPDLPGALAKRAYRVLADAAAADAAGILASRGPALEDALLGGDEAPAAARGARLRLLLHVVSALPDSDLHWVPLVLPEAVFGVKEANARARAAAFELILAMARRMASGGSVRAVRGLLPAAASLDEFLTMLMAGLVARTPHMVAATVVALARVLFELHGLMAAEGASRCADDAAALAAGPRRASILTQLVGDMVALLGSASREIAKAVLGFVKVALSVLPSDVFLDTSATESGDCLLAGIVRGVLAWQGAHQMHFKERVRHLLERLVRRFGYERVASHTPAEHVRLLAAIRKRREQARRRRARAAAEGTSEAAEGHSESEDGGPTIGRSERFERAIASSDSEDSGADGEIDDAVLDAVDVRPADADRSLARRLRLAARLAGDGRRAMASPAPPDDSDGDAAYDAAGKLVVRHEDGENGGDDSDSEDGAPAQPAAKRRRRAGGDVRRRADKFEPYAYVPMARRAARGARTTARFFNRSRR